MKDKNLPNDYNSLSLEELTTEANKMIEELENEKNAMQMNHLTMIEQIKNTMKAEKETLEKLNKAQKKMTAELENEKNAIQMKYLTLVEQTKNSQDEFLNAEEFDIASVICPVTAIHGPRH